MNTPPNREETLFHAALELPVAERAAYLANACVGDVALRQRVEELLQAHLQAGDFLEQPPTEIAQPGVETPAPEGRIRLGAGGTQRMERATEKPGDKIDRYKLLQKLGEGGCGVVFMAEQSEPVRRKVALKVIKLGMDTKEVVARFEAERQALAMMDHPNIAKVLDGGATNTGRPYFVMELVRGIPITQYCDENNLATPRRLDLFIKVCQAVQHAHQKGIIHRDLKPSNILVTLHDGVPVPKVIDFGIAKATDQSLTDKTLFTELNAFMGTPAYTSPEQAEMSGLDIDTRADIYSLGVLLYELLSGQLPFNPDTLMKAGLDEMRRTIREVEPPRPSTRLGTVTNADLVTIAKHRGIEAARLATLLRGDLDWIVMKALEKDRARRYDTANSFAQDIQRYLGNEAVLACPPSFAYVFTKLVRRHKLAFAAVAAVLATMIVGTVVSLWQANEARTARDGEKEQRTQAETERGKAVIERDRALKAEQEAKDQRQESERNLYAASMNLAQVAWEDNNLGHLRGLLAETRTYTNRGFEWYYWQRLAHLELRTFRGHSGQIQSVAFSPDGRRIVTGSEDGTVKLWDVENGHELLTIKSRGGWVTSVAFSPDGRRIVTGSDDRTAKIWNAENGRELLTLRGHTDVVDSVAFSPDGRRIITGSNDRTAKVWDAENGRELLSLAGHGNPVASVAFAPDGRRIATGSHDKMAKLWDAGDGRELLSLKGHTGPITSVAFSPDGQRVVTGGFDNRTKVWDADSGRELRTLNTFMGHTKLVTSVAFSPDGRRIVTGSDDRTAKVWDAESGGVLQTFKGHIDWVTSATFSPDGRHIVTGSNDGTAKLWETEHRRELPKLVGLNLLLSSLAFASDGLRIVSVSYDSPAKVSDGVNGRELFTLKGRITSAAFAPDARRIVTGNYDGTATVWDAQDGHELLSLNVHIIPPTSVGIAVASTPVTSVAFSPNGRRIATGSFDRTAKVWDAENGRELLALQGNTSSISALAFSRDNRRIVTGRDDGAVNVWDAENGRELLTLKGHKERVGTIAFSTDGRRIITGSEDSTAKVWDAENGRELLALRGHVGEVKLVAFFPNDRRIITGGWDHSAKIWDAENGRELLALKEQSGDVLSVYFPTDGRRMVTGSGAGFTLEWMTASPEEVAAWEKEEQGR